MGNGAGTRRLRDDSDAVVTFDPRALVLDVPDDGRVVELLAVTRTSRAPQLDRFSPRVTADAADLLPALRPRRALPRS